MPPLLSVRNLSIGFETETGLVPGVKDVSFDVNRGEIVALVGESGSGKSITSLSILQLLPTPPARYLSGEILFTDADRRPHTDAPVFATPSPAQTISLLEQGPDEMRRLRGASIAMIFQEPMTSLNPVFTCGGQVAEAIRAHRDISAAEARQETIRLFEKVQLPDPPGVFSRYPHQLSGGQKQRVMIAMAMSCRPSLLICDEPTTALDVTVQKTILELIRHLQQTEDMGVIFITHDLGVVAEIADRAVVLYKGSMVESGSVGELFRNPQHPYTKGLLNCRPALHPKGERLPVVADYLEGRITLGVPGLLTPSPLSGTSGASPNRDAAPESSAPATPFTPSEATPSNTHTIQSRSDLLAGSSPHREKLVQVENLQVWYPAQKTWTGKVLRYTHAVDGVTFDVYKGETLGLVGESGCGKTTLGRALLRLITPTGGRILFNGADLNTLSETAMRSMRAHIQLIFQDPYSSLNPRMTIGSAIAEVLQVHGLATTAAERRQQVVQLLEKVSLRAEHYDRYPHEFSGGQRQRIVIARALALRPSFIVADESVSALDVSVQAQVLNLLNDLKKEFGFTIVFISHDLSVIRYISDRILVMNQGRIEEIGEADAVYRNPKSDYTKRLIAAVPKV